MVAVSDIKKTKLNKIKNKNLIKSTNYKEILAIKEIDTVIILTESGNHYKVAKDALLNKKNIIVEKPLCLKLKQVDELIKISKKYKKKIFVIMQNNSIIPYKLQKIILIKINLVKL